MAKITNIEYGKDKNGVHMKITTFDGGQKVWVNAKYDADIFESVVPDSEHELHKDGDFWKIGAEGSKLVPQSKKAAEIQVAQERKSDSIAFFNATNAAIKIVESDPAYSNREMTVERIQESIRFWRDWFLSEWASHNDSQTKPPF